MARSRGPRGPWDADAPTRAIVRDGIAVGIATGAYGISFGAISVVSRSRRVAVLRPLAARVHRSLAVRPGRGHRRRREPAVRRRLRTPPGHPQHALRPQGGAHARLARPSARRCRTPADRRVLGDDRDPHARAGTPGSASSRPGSRCSCSGTSRPSSAPWPETPSAIPAPTASTPRSGGAFLGLLWPRLGTTPSTGSPRCSPRPWPWCWCPLTPAGVPVLAAAVVALGLGLLGRGAPTEEPR